MPDTAEAQKPMKAERNRRLGRSSYWGSDALSWLYTKNLRVGWGGECAGTAACGATGCGMLPSSDAVAHKRGCQCAGLAAEHIPRASYEPRETQINLSSN